MNDERQAVWDFHERFGHPIAMSPGAIDDERVRQRLRLMFEELFEIAEACVDRDDYRDGLTYARAAIQIIIAKTPIRIDLPAVADGLGDLRYVLIGTELEFGIDGGPVFEAIHETNMTKEPNGLDKPIKPAGWKPPDIASILRHQGWRG